MQKLYENVMIVGDKLAHLATNNLTGPQLWRVTYLELSIKPRRTLELNVVRSQDSLPGGGCYVYAQRPVIWEILCPA